MRGRGKCSKDDVSRPRGVVVAVAGKGLGVRGRALRVVEGLVPMPGVGMSAPDGAKAQQ